MFSLKAYKFRVEINDLRKELKNLEGVCHSQEKEEEITNEIRRLNNEYIKHVNESLCGCSFKKVRLTND